MRVIGPISPKNPFQRLADEIKREFDVFDYVSHRELGQPDANFLEHEGQYFIEVAVPGLEKSDLDVSVKNGQLVVSAKTVGLPTGEAARPKYKFREFGFSGFKRSFQLPKDAAVDSVTARCEKGILTLSIPRKVEEAALSISID